MGNKEILCTYKYKNSYSFDWLDENEIEDWIEENKDKYEDIEVVKIKVTDIIYQS